MYSLKAFNKPFFVAVSAVFFLLLFPFLGKSQSVITNFNQTIYNDAFDNNNAEWPIVTNNESFFIIQNGEFIINRNLKTPFVIFNSNAKEPETYRLSTAVKLDEKASDQNGVGIVFMMQDNGKGGYKGGFFLEVGIDKKYRIVQIAGSAMLPITGNKNNQGWIKNSALKPAGTYNVLTINVGNKYADIYLNEKYITTITDQSYSPGKMGYIVEGGTKAKADYLTLSVPGAPKEEEPIKKKTEIVTENKELVKETTTKDTLKTNVVDVNPESGDILTLTQSIIKIKTQLNKANKTVDSLRKQLLTPSKLATDNKELSSAIKILEEQIVDKNADIDSLKSENEKLKKYEKIVIGNENADLVISLSKLLQNEKQQKEIFAAKNKKLTDSIASLNREMGRVGAVKKSRINVIKQNIAETKSADTTSVNSIKPDSSALPIMPVLVNTDSLKAKKDSVVVPLIIDNKDTLKAKLDTISTPVIENKESIVNPVLPKEKAKTKKAKKEARSKPVIENTETIKIKSDSIIVAPVLDKKDTIKQNIINNIQPKTDSLPQTNPK